LVSCTGLSLEVCLGLGGPSRPRCISLPEGERSMAARTSHARCPAASTLLVRSRATPFEVSSRRGALASTERTPPTGVRRSAPFTTFAAVRRRACRPAAGRSGLRCFGGARCTSRSGPSVSPPVQVWLLLGEPAARLGFRRVTRHYAPSVIRASAVSPRRLQRGDEHLCAGRHRPPSC